MKNLLYTLIISAIGVIVFSALKILSDHYLYGWGIFIFGLIFVFTLTYWFLLLNRNKQQS
ncbi:hypothetical protein CA2015_1854 [Cyclobacterium amurskyense]|uniref:Uncharacterized protein n=1 Tax=Cyclobacterium amurskyense TaxID=320787 RepID=A0A0H4PDT3_9BACT|nr:hypothetical protein CA2015_1854 [Cyclobacterium amurskyense]